jgi:hypothetical protein
MKIKTKIEKIFVVKPTKGFILPGEKVVITFHAAHYIVQDYLNSGAGLKKQIREGTTVSSPGCQ